MFLNADIINFFWLKIQKKKFEIFKRYLTKPLHP